MAYKSLNQEKQYNQEISGKLGKGLGIKNAAKKILASVESTQAT